MPAKPKYLIPLSLAAILLPNITMASEPCGPGLDVLILIGMMAISFFTGIVSLILLSIQPKARKAFNVFLIINFILHIALFITWYQGFSNYDRKSSKLTAFLHNAFVQDSYHGAALHPTTIAVLLFWAIMTAHFIRHNRKQKTSIPY